jgi:hypothetical protein
VRTGPKAREWRRRCSEQVGVTPSSNPGRGEGESVVLRPVPSPAREGEHYEPKHGCGAELNESTGHRAGAANRRDRAPVSVNSLRQDKIRTARA